MRPKYPSPFIRALIVGFIAALSLPAHSRQAPPPEPATASAYEKGLEELEKGEWKNALNIWYSAMATAAQKPDPRIGFAFVEEVTKRSARQYYEIAGQMYFWGFRDADMQHHHAAFRAELERLKPILPGQLYDSLRKSLRELDPSFQADIREFWIKSDPFPSTAYNQRLLEHWERIAYARQNYTFNSSTAYDTDDRGLIYVRFGAPAEIKKRNISINHLNDPVTGNRIDLQNNISFSFEVWYYPSGDGETASYVFGVPGEGGPFGLQPGILSLVPVAGNRISSYYNEQDALLNATSAQRGVLEGSEDRSLFVLPGYNSVSREGAELMIKYAVLEEVGAMDPFYNSLYRQTANDLIRAELGGTGEKFSKSAAPNLIKYDQKEVSASVLRDQRMPAGISAQKNTAQNLDLFKKFYRFLDEGNRPVYMLVTEALDLSPAIFRIAQTGNAESLFQLNTLSTYDDKWNLAKVQPHILPLNNGGHFGKGVYFFGEAERPSHLMFESQLVDTAYAEAAQKHELFDAHIIASTYREELEFPSPLSAGKTDEILISDVILGDSQPEQAESRIPFVPRSIPAFNASDEILVYFEVYNIPDGTDFQIEYYFEHAGKKGGRVEDKGSVILNYTAASGIEKIWFEAPLQDLEEGASYNVVLNLRMENLPAGHLRRVPFSIGE